MNNNSLTLHKIDLHMPSFKYLKSILKLSLVLLTLSACSNEIKKHNEIVLGDYSLQFPSEFYLVEEKGIDSYVGKVTNGHIEFAFDFGYYSNPLTKSINEYVSDDALKWNALASKGLLPQGNAPQYLVKQTTLLDYINLDSNLYELIYLFKNDTIRYQIQIPAQITDSQIEVDTIDNIVYKFVEGPDYLGLHVKDLSSFNKSINSFKSLSITVASKSGMGPNEVMSILKTCKVIK